MSLRPHGTIRFPQEEFSLNLISGDLPKSFQKIQFNSNLTRLIGIFV